MVSRTFKLFRTLPNWSLVYNPNKKNNKETPQKITHLGIEMIYIHKLIITIDELLWNHSIQ